MTHHNYSGSVKPTYLVAMLFVGIVLGLGAGWLLNSSDAPHAAMNESSGDTNDENEILCVRQCGSDATRQFRARSLTRQSRRIGRRHCFVCVHTLKRAWFCV